MIFYVYISVAITKRGLKMKNIVITVLGFLVTVSLLLLMTSLIAKPQLTVAEHLDPKSAPPVVIEPEEPNDPPENNPQPPSATVEPSLDINSDIEVEKVDIKITEALEFTKNVEFKHEWTNTKLIGTELDEMDREAVPLMQTTPTYPIVALQKGIEGWVKLTFDVDATGMANNIKIVEASHRNIFDKEAKRALRKWKFEPGKSNGMATGLNNQYVTMQFNLLDN